MHHLSALRLLMTIWVRDSRVMADLSDSERGERAI
jgi:hypothetical protein